MNCLIAENEGDASYNTACGTLYAFRCDLRMMNCTIAGNNMEHISGIFLDEILSADIANCILANRNSHRIRYYTHHSCFEDSWYSGNGNLIAPPRFADPVNGVYWLQPDSPCIDAGTSENAPATGLRGMVRPQGDGVDMGAYEHAFGKLAVVIEPDGARRAGARWSPVSGWPFQSGRVIDILAGLQDRKSTRLNSSHYS